METELRNPKWITAPFPFVFPSRNASEAIQAWLDGSVYRRPPVDHDRIVRYLLRGHCFVAQPAIARDPFAESLIAYPYESVFATDGKWIWNKTVAYWVEHYHLKLPAAFVRHIRRTRFRMPPGSSVDKQDVAKAFRLLNEAGRFTVGIAD